MSSKGTQNMSAHDEQASPELLPSKSTKDALAPSSEASQAKSQLFLNELKDGVTGTIIVMVCRIWDVHAVSGRYLSTDFVVSDAQGAAIHCTAKATIAHNFIKLKEGPVYSIKGFVVQANKDEYRIFKDHAFILEFDGATSVRKASGTDGGFDRYPFQLTDVAGYLTNVGRITYQRTGSRTLDFYLSDGRGQAIRVTLWGGLGDALVEKKTSNVGLYPIVLTSFR